jgi:hypothetical protein
MAYAEEPAKSPAEAAGSSTSTAAGKNGETRNLRQRSAGLTRLSLGRPTPQTRHKRTYHPRTAPIGAPSAPG